MKKVFLALACLMLLGCVPVERADPNAAVDLTAAPASEVEVVAEEINQ
jgi:hypothetical protein